MTLFSPAQKRRSVPRDDRPRRKIPTGPPRLMESSRERRDRTSAESWNAIVDAVRRSATARLELLKDRGGSDRISCPWARLIACDKACRCGGCGTVTVKFLREHYTKLSAEVATPIKIRYSWRSE